ncbi:hypothetical protein GQ44DRAFT_706314 [Phaeosphaeriaceae sp. PMI808]|nr:hypothetical protein GQ44DRAFT_706314 [Phaeosphaeriaceae sp. PMI808]
MPSSELPEVDEDLIDESPSTTAQSSSTITPKRGPGRPKAGPSYASIILEQQNAYLNGPSGTKKEKLNIRKIKAYQARWGAKNKPSDTDGIEGLRARMWRKPNSPPKCASCHAGRKRNPSNDLIPIGLDPEDCLPCGCLFRKAIVEELLLLKNYKPLTNNEKDTVIPVDIMTKFADFVCNVMGVNGNNYENLLDRKLQAAARGKAAKTHGNKINLSDSFV